MSKLIELLNKSIRKEPTTEEIEEADEIFFNYFNNLFENDIIINWKNKGKIIYTIKNLIKVSILDRNYDIHNLIDYSFPYIEFTWNTNSIFKVLIHIDTNNRNNLDYIRKYKLLYKSNEYINIFNIIKKALGDYYYLNWFYFYYDLEKEKFIFGINYKETYYIIFSYYLMLLVPLFNSKGSFSTNYLDISNKLSKDIIDELNISSNFFSFNLKYDVKVKYLDELLQHNTTYDNFISYVKEQLEYEHIIDYYYLNIECKINNQILIDKKRFECKHNLQKYNSLLWIINKMYNNIDDGHYDD